MQLISSQFLVVHQQGIALSRIFSPRAPVRSAVLPSRCSRQQFLAWGHHPCRFHAAAVLVGASSDLPSSAFAAAYPVVLALPAISMALDCCCAHCSHLLIINLLGGGPPRRSRLCQSCSTSCWASCFCSCSSSCRHCRQEMSCCSWICCCGQVRGGGGGGGCWTASCWACRYCCRCCCWQPHKQSCSMETGLSAATLQQIQDMISGRYQCHAVQEH